VFEAVRGRIVGGDAFDTQPAGADGLGILVKAQPALQTSLLDFLEALPRDRLGPWASGGWDVALKDAEIKARFDRLLAAWSKDGSAMLKMTAANVLRTRQGGR